MKLKTTLALVLLLASGFALYRSQSQIPFLASTPPDENRGKAREMLAELTPDRLASVVVRRDGKEVVRLDRTFSEGFVTTGDWPASANEARRVYDLVGNLQSRFLDVESKQANLPVSIDVLTREDVALAGTALLARAIVDSPLASVVAWVATRQARQVRLLLGESTASDYRFVRPTLLRIEGIDETLRLAPGLVGELTRPADLYRQRRLFPAERVARLSNPQERIEKLNARELIVEQEGSPRLRLVRGRDGWSMREPTHDHLDPEAAEKLLSGVADLWVEQFVTPSAADGLADAKQKLRVTRNDGSVVTLLLGERSRINAPPPPLRPGAPPPPQDAYRYAKLANSDLVFEVQDGRLNDVFVTVETLRDPRIARFNPEDAELLVLREGGKTVNLVKEKKDSWRMTSPLDVPADNEKVDELLRKLSTLESPDKDLLSPARRAAVAAGVLGADSVLNALSATLTTLRTLAPFDQKQPTTEVTVVVREKARADDRDRSKERTFTLRLVKPADEKRLLIQQIGWPRIDAVEDSLLSLLDKPALAYRGKQLFDFTASDVARVEIRATAVAGNDPKAKPRPEQTIVLQRNGNDWSLTQPMKVRADAMRVNDLLDALGKAKALTYVEKPGIDKPTLEVKLTFTDASKPARTLTLGAARGNEPGYFARRDGSPDTFVVAADLRNKLTSPALSYLPSTLWQIDPGDEIVRLSLAKAGQEPYQLSRKENQWQVSGPFTVAAPSDVVEHLLSALRSPQASEYRAFPAGDLVPFGLNKPIVTVTLETRLGKRHTLSLGDVSKSGKPGRFATTGEGVFVVADTLAKTVDQSALDFLDRELLQFDVASVQSIARQRGGETLKLVKQGDGWKVAQPSEQPADERKVPELVRLMSSLRAEKIVAYKPKELKSYGLDQPEAAWTVQLADGSKTLLVGAERPGGERIVQVKDAPVIGILSAKEAKQLLAPPLAFRNHDLVRAVDADTMSFTAGDRALTFTRPEGSWKVTKPVVADADHDALETYFNNLARLRADELVSDKPSEADLARFGLSKPQARWKVFLDDNLEVDLVVGNTEPGGKRRYARLGDKGMVFLLSEPLSNQSMAEYRPRAIWQENVDPAQIETIKFGYNKDPFELKKIGDAWQVVGQPDLKLNQETVNDTLSALRDLKLERYVKDDGADWKLYGLAPVELTLEVETPTGKQVLLIGGLEGDSKRRYARSPSSKFKDVFVLDEATSTRLTRSRSTLTQPMKK